MKKEISFALLIILLAVLETKIRLWSGHSPDLLLAGLVGLAGSITILELILFSIIGFLFLAGPIISTELILIIVIVAFAHFLRLFVLGRSPLLQPPLIAIAILMFYLETSGLKILSIPIALVEIILVSLGVSFLTYLLNLLIEEM